MTKISQVTARQIFDSRSIPAVEVLVKLEDGTITCSSSPSGLSKSTYEAVELRDQDTNVFGGQGVSKAVNNVNTLIGPKLTGMDCRDQQAIDKIMIDLDGTPNKSALGANAILPVSQAVAKAGAKSNSEPIYSYISKFINQAQTTKLPVPMFNVFEGGKHGGNYIDFQEFLIVPASSKNFSESMDIGVSVYHSLKKRLAESNKSRLTADEGGFSPDVGSHQDALNLLREAINGTTYSFSLDVFLGIDCAANSFWEKDKYRLHIRPEPYSAGELFEMYKNLASEFSLIYLEDPFGEDDLDGWKKLFSEVGSKVLIVGDDLISTNPFRLQNAVGSKTVGGVIIKPNQIGTVTEAIAVVEIAKYTGLKVVVSHRSGETEDSFIADFAVGVGADYVKFGAPARERNIKYNRLLAIGTEIASK